jgi:aminoglycoside phosphotransferase
VFGCCTLAGGRSKVQIARLETRGCHNWGTLGGRCDIASNALTPKDIFERHKLKFKTFEPAGAGYDNHVFMSEDYVLRISRNNTVADHAREARLAQAALKLGVKTAACVAFGQDYSIWKRIPGNRSDRETSPQSLWEALLNDLEKLHAQPLETSPLDLPVEWISHEVWIERTQNMAGWDMGERKALENILISKHPIKHQVFIHGDAWQDNVLEFNGSYAGLIDWTGAGWSSLEFECSRLEKPALELALTRWRAKLDVELMFKMRLELLLRVGTLRHMDWFAVREIMTKLS